MPHCQVILVKNDHFEWKWRVLLILELKRHAYFDEINWTEVAERKCRPPFKVTEFPLEMDDTLDLVQLIIGIAEEIGPDVAERLRSNLNEMQWINQCFIYFSFQIDYTYVAPEHQLWARNIVCCCIQILMKRYYFLKWSENAFEKPHIQSK